MTDQEVKDLEILKGSVQHMHDHSSRMELLRLSVLFVMVFAFAGTYERVDWTEINATLEDINGLAHLSGVPGPSLGVDPWQGFFFLYAILGHSRDWAWRADADSWPIELAREQLASYERKHPASAEQDIGGELDREAVRRRAARVQKSLARGVRAKYAEVFALELGVPVAKVRIDLRGFVGLLPFLLICGETYLYLLRRRWHLSEDLLKKRLAELEARAPGSVATADKLLLGGQGYGHHVTRATAAAYLLSVVGLCVLVARESSGFWKLNWVDLHALLSVIWPLAFYAMACAANASAGMERQITAVSSMVLPPSRLRSAWEAWRRFWRVLGSQLRPQVWVASGSLLTLASLFLALGMDSCGNPKVGYELALNHSAREPADPEAWRPSEDTSVWWPPALWTDAHLGSKQWKDEEGEINVERVQTVSRPGRLLVRLEEGLGTGVYIAAVAMAVLTIPFLAASWRLPKVLRKTGFAEVAARLCGVVVLFNVVDWYVYFMPAPAKTAFLVSAWLVPVVLGGLSVFWHGLRRRIEGARALGLLAVTPWIVCVAALMLPLGYALPGVPIYLAGAAVMWVGYRQVCRA